ncbi:hypothetical protein TNCV_4491611 [Trichonephila clavipes]|nr:hypothetical protein TNCV_4491611 [Trichonephila clavipes]
MPYTLLRRGDKSGEWAGMEESENDVGNLEQLLYADEHYLVGKLPLGDHLGKILHGVEEYHQRNVGSLRECNGRALDLSLLLQGVWKWFVEQLLCLRLLVSLNESLWGQQVLAARSFDPSLLVVFLSSPDPVFHEWVPSRDNCSHQFLTATLNDTPG